jgi:hypothetical protein
MVTPPVTGILQSKPKVKKIKFDLLRDLPESVGSRFEEEHKVYFRETDSTEILDAIGQTIRAESEPEENVVYDTHLVGIMPTELGGRIAANMRLWDNVASLSFATPRRSVSLIFETQIFPLSVGYN